MSVTFSIQANSQWEECEILAQVDTVPRTGELVQFHVSADDESRILTGRVSDVAHIVYHSKSGISEHPSVKVFIENVFE